MTVYTTEEAVALPRDLADRGWKLIIRAHDRMFAISTRWGGTVTSATIDEVVTNARAMTRYIEQRIKHEHRRRTTIPGQNNDRSESST